MIASPYDRCCPEPTDHLLGASRRRAPATVDPRPEPGTSRERSVTERPGGSRRRRTIPRWGAFEAVLFDFGHTLFDSTDLASRCSRFEAAARLKLDVDGFRSVWDAIRAGRGSRSSREGSGSGRHRPRAVLARAARERHGLGCSPGLRGSRPRRVGRRVRTVVRARGVQAGCPHLRPGWSWWSRPRTPAPADAASCRRADG